MKKSIAYVGNDVHKETISVAVYDEDKKEPVLEKTIRNGKINVLKFYKKLSKKYEIRACYEAGCNGYTLHRWLKEIEIKCDVISTLSIPQKAGEKKKKTDKRDAKKLGRLYKIGELDTIHIPEEKEEAVRNITRLREQIVKQIKQTKQYILKFLLAKGLVYRDGTNWTQKHWRYLRGIKLEDQTEQYVLDRYLAMLECSLLEEARVMRKIEEIVETKEYKEKVAKLKCLKGINTVTALSLIAEIIDFKRFNNPRALMSYLGLVPGEQSSGEKEKKLGITKQGNNRVRRLLVEAAWHYRHRPYVSRELKKRCEGQNLEVIDYSWLAQQRLNKRYMALTYRGKNSKKIVVAIARELSGFIWTLMVKNGAYDTRKSA